MSTDAAGPIGIRVERWDHGWEVHVRDIGVTQCETLVDAEQQVRDYLETVFGTFPTVKLVWDVTGAEQAVGSDKGLADEVDEFTDRLSVTQRAHQTIRFDDAWRGIDEGTFL